LKFLVLWHFDVMRLTPEVVRAISEQPKYGERLEKQGKLECRYHIVGSHGGAWIYNVESNEELDRLLATSPVYPQTPKRFPPKPFCFNSVCNTTVVKFGSSDQCLIRPSLILDINEPDS